MFNFDDISICNLLKHFIMKKTLLYLLLFIANFVNAQYNPQVLVDLYNGPTSGFGVMNMASSAQLENQLFFTLLDEGGKKIYVTDGTAANTHVLTTTPTYVGLFAFDNQIYYSFVDPVNGGQLWKTDGTASGTVLVTTFGGGNYSNPSNYLIVGNKMFFAAGNTASPNAKQLYSLQEGSNVPQLLSSSIYGVNNLTKYNNQVVFTASSIQVEHYLYQEPYITDGTIGGTTIIKDIKPGNDGSSPDGYFLYMDKIYFSADDGTHGTELWSTNGTATGTQLVKDINPGTASAFYSLNASTADGILFFPANDGVHGNEIWYSYGTAANTALLIDINPNGNSNPNGLVNIGNGSTLVFTADDGVHGSELWKTNGTAQFTSMIKDINPGSESSSYSIRKSNALCPNIIFFDATDNSNDNIEPWYTDGTPENTQMIANLNLAGSSVNYETFYIAFKNKIYFAAQTGTGNELFVMDQICTLGVETNQKPEFTVYPNPTKDMVKIETTAEISTIEIYNTLGQLVETVAGNKKELNISGFSNGIYFLNITTTDKLKSVQKIIKN